MITTQNTGGPDVMEDGREGFLVPAGSVEALREKMEWCVRHPEPVAEMGRAAYRKAQKFTWEQYGRSYGKVLLAIFGASSNARQED